MNLRISTMTACAEIKSNINLSKLYENTDISDFIKYVEHGDNNYKGYAKKNEKVKRCPGPDGKIMKIIITKWKR